MKRRPLWLLLAGLALQAEDGVHLSTFSRSEDPWQAGIAQSYLRAKVGLHYDSHPAARIDQELFPLGEDALPNLEGGLFRAEFAGHLYAPLSEPGGLGIRSRLWFQTDLYLNEDRFRDPWSGSREEIDLSDRFDRYRWRFEHGLSFGQGVRLDLLPLVGQEFLGRQGNPYLSTYVGVQPMLTLPVNEGWNLFLGYRYRHEFFRGGGSDYDHHLGFFGSRLKFGERLLLLSFSGGRHRNEFNPWSYWEGRARLDLFSRLPFQLEGRIALAYRFRDLDDTFSPRDRESHQFSSNLTLVKHFGDHLFAEAWWDFGLSRGREVIDYDRHVAGVNVGLSF